MRIVLAVTSVLLVAAPAGADPLRDQLGSKSPCFYDEPPGTVVWPDAGGFDAAPPGYEKDKAEPAAEGKSVDGNARVAKGSAAFYEWCAQTVKVTIDGKTQLVTGTAFATMGRSADGEQQFYENHIAQWAIPVANDQASKAAKPAAFPAGADAAPYATAAVAKLASTKKLAAIGDKNLIVVGSAPGEVWKGAAAKKTLKSWNLDLAVDLAAASQDTAKEIGNQVWVVATVTAQAHGKKDATPLTYRVMYGLTYKGKHGAKGKKKWTLCIVHFALVQ